MTKFQMLTAGTVLATLVLIAIGALVRSSGSGLGCPDWPLCHGNWHPPLERTAIIEYTHRTAAAVVGLLVVIVVVGIVRRHRGDRTQLRLSAAALVLLAFQAWLGKVTVERELPPSVVTVHLATALLLLAVLATMCALSFVGEGRTRIDTPERKRVLRITLNGALITYLVLLSGAYVVNVDATAACTTWPGCSAAPIPFIDGGFEQHIHWLHRFMVLGGGLAVLGVCLGVLWAESSGALLRRAAWTLGGLYGVQILVGASNIWTDFSIEFDYRHD